MSPPRKKFHAENRLIVCAVCWKKSSSMRPVAASGLDRIKKYHNPDYDPCDDRQPTALCSRCNNLLLQIDAGAKSPRSLPPVFPLYRKPRQQDIPNSAIASFVKQRAFVPLEFLTTTKRFSRIHSEDHLQWLILCHLH